jgi:hypothetical protein
MNKPLIFGKLRALFRLRNFLLMAGNFKGSASNPQFSQIFAYVRVIL